MSGFNTPIKPEGITVETPGTDATIPDTESFQGSPTNEYYQSLVTANEQLLRENKRLKQELDYYKHKPGETPSTVLQITHKNTEDEYYALDLVPYTTKHRKRNLPVRNAEGEIIGTVNTEGNLLTEAFNAEVEQLTKKRKINSETKNGGSITRRKRGGNKKSCKRTKKH
jgi:hypothetical protein